MDTNKSTHSKLLINLYTIIAIILILIPEKIAESILILDNINRKNKLSKLAPLWRKRADLRFSTFSMKELRLTARELNLFGYSTDTRSKLTNRIIKTLSKKNSINH